MEQVQPSPNSRGNTGISGAQIGDNMPVDPGSCLRSLCAEALGPWENQHWVLVTEAGQAQVGQASAQSVLSGPRHPLTL